MDIKFQNGRLLSKNDKFSMYEIYTNNGLNYYMCLPNEETFDLQMVIDFPETTVEDEKLESALKICDTLYDSRVNYIYLLTDVTTNDVASASMENDDRAFRILFEELCKYTIHANEILKKTVDANISQVIQVVTQTDNDGKFMDWLDVTYPDYFKKMDLSKLVKFDLNLNDDDSWTTRGGPTNGGSSMENTNNLNKPKVKKLMPPNKHGYLNITFAIVVISLALVFGIGLAWLLIK